MEAKRKVVVTGLGLVTPLGLEVQENWRKALTGVSGLTRLTLPGTAGSPMRAVGAVCQQDWDRVANQFPGDASTEGERRTVFALWAARAALLDANLLDPTSGHERWGVMLAAGLGIYLPEDIHRWTTPEGKFDLVSFAREYADVHKESMIRNPSHRAAALVGQRFGLLGPNGTVTSACASATQAIGVAFRTIQRGEADMVVAGGSDSMINPVGLVGFALLQAAVMGPGEPGAACRPFDRKRSGLVIGEGAGVVILEAEQHAIGRGARIYAEVAGYASSMDAYQVTAPHPQGLGAVLCMRGALRDAGMDLTEVDYINAHGTGTKLNDATETLAIKEVFGARAYDIAISSSKSLIGHLMAAAGGPEFVFTVLTVHTDQVHPTINLTQPDPKCDLDYVPNVKRSRTVRAALSNSFGFGGQNASVIAQKYAL